MVFADTVDTVEPEAEEYLQSEQAPVLAKAMHEAIGSVEDFAEEAKTLMKRVQKETGIKGKPLFMTMRSLLTGSVHGPDLNQLLLLLGPDKLQRRLQAYL